MIIPSAFVATACKAPPPPSPSIGADQLMKCTKSWETEVRYAGLEMAPLMRRLSCHGNDGIGERGECGRGITTRGEGSSGSSIQASELARSVTAGVSSSLKRRGSRDTLELVARKGLLLARGVLSLVGTTPALRARRDTLPPVDSGGLGRRNAPLPPITGAAGTCHKGGAVMLTALSTPTHAIPSVRLKEQHCMIPSSLSTARVIIQIGGHRWGKVVRKNWWRYLEC